MRDQQERNAQGGGGVVNDRGAGAPGVIEVLLARVRARWRRLVLWRAITQASLTASGVLVIALVLARWAGGSAPALALLGAAAFVVAIAAAMWALRPVRERPSDIRIARFIEERDATLDQRLVSAVDVMARQAADPVARAVLADAARAAARVDVAAIVSGPRLRRASVQVLAATITLIAVLFLGRHAARQSWDSAALLLFPSHLVLEVVPGSARVQAGAGLTITARLVGSRAPAGAQFLRMAWDDSATLQTVRMDGDGTGRYQLSLPAIPASFRYRIAAGGQQSSVYTISVDTPPRVTRIDVEYLSSPALGRPSHVDEDSGDIYAPAGSQVRVRVHTDRPANGRMNLAGGSTIDLKPDGAATRLTGALTVVQDASYRVALVGHDGLRNPGDTEYFIRTLEDRPPDVRVLRPARDRAVTRLEEVEIEAQADDDFQVERVDLVYAVVGGAERIVALPVPRGSASVTGRYTLCLEELDVRPGDFVSYYVRARDVGRGRRSAESRSDIFFLEVRPFDQEFSLAQSQSTAGGRGNRQLDELVTAQKEVIVATWKLDRRGAATGAKSDADIRAVGRAEAELQTRVVETSSAFRESTMRDPRGRRPSQPGGRGGTDPQSGQLRAGQTLPEEDAMTAAATALGKAVSALDALKTPAALPPEMEALNHLLRAQSQVKQRQVARQQAGSQSGSNRSNEDLSSLFDRELQRQQQTNYESQGSSEQRDGKNQGALDKIRELARRQDELSRRQAELARNRASLSEEAQEEQKRELDRLTREQSALRQQAEDMARQMAGEGRQSGSKGDEQMQAVSDAMREAVNELRRQDPTRASARSAQALQKLRELEARLGRPAPDERRRALGDTELEAREIADAQRAVASEVSKTAQDDRSSDRIQRLAAEEERLAERVKRLEQTLKAQTPAPAAKGTGRDPVQGQALQQAAGDAARALEQLRLAERMARSAAQIRAGGKPAQERRPSSGEIAGVQQDVARSLDRLADQLSAGRTGLDGDARKLSDQRARAQSLRDRLERLSGASQSAGQMPSQAGKATSAGAPGKETRGSRPGGGDGGAEAGSVRDEYVRQLEQAQALLEELRRDDPSMSAGNAGFTLEGQGMALSAPGTEAFKQDFSKWEQLRRQAVIALENAESALTKKLQSKSSRDRSASGEDDRPPSGYQSQVDAYFKAIASKKTR